MQLKFNVISNLEVIQTLEEATSPERTGGLRIYYMTMFININIYVYCIYMYTWTWDDLG